MVSMCPVCGGTGRKRRSFYPDLGPAGSNEWVHCRSCHGSGVICENATDFMRFARPFDKVSLWPKMLDVT